jgi:hypothetical protein
MYCREIKLPAGKVTSFGGKKESDPMRKALSFKASPSGSAAESTPKRGARMSSISKISPIDESVPSTDSPTSGTKKPPTRTSSVGLKSAPSELNLTEDAPKSISSRDRKAISTSNLNAKQESGAPPLLTAKQPSQKKLTDDRQQRGSIAKRSSAVQ